MNPLFVVPGYARELRKIADELGLESTEASRAQQCFKRLAKTAHKCMVSDDFDPADWGSMTCRISTEKQKMEFFESRGWVPDCLKDSGAIGEDLDGLGSLWYCLQLPKSMRHGHDKLCFDMMGRFIIGLYQCDLIVLAFPAKSTFDLGVPSWETITFLDTIQESEWKHWSDQNIIHCRLDAGAVAWIPYGWSFVAIALVPNIENKAEAVPIVDKSSNSGPQYWSNFCTMALVSRALFDKLEKPLRIMIQRHIAATSG